MKNLVISLFIFLLSESAYGITKIEIILFGDSGVGKTSLLKNLSKLNDKHEIKSLNQNLVIKLTDVSFTFSEVNDLKSLEKKLPKFYNIKKKFVIFLIFDISDLNSYFMFHENVDYFKQLSKKSILVVIGNKNDLNHKREVCTVISHRFSTKVNALYYELNALAGPGLIRPLLDMSDIYEIKKNHSSFPLDILIRFSDPFSRSFYNQESFQGIVQSLKENELDKLSNDCYMKLNLLLRKKKKNIPLIDFKYWTYYLSMSLNLSLYSPKLESILYHDFDVSLLQYLEGNLFRWKNKFNQEIDQNKLESVMEALKQESDYILFIEVVRHLTNMKDLDDVFLLLDLFKNLESFHQSSINRIKKILTEHPTGQHIIFDLNEEAANVKSPFYTNGGRYSSLALIVQNILDL